jgi:large subunit ribosomal protein L4
MSEEYLIEKIVLDIEGNKVGEASVNKEFFSFKGYSHLIHPTVIWQQNKKRAGTHSTLTKADMKGGNKKPWKQKGTGRARAGSSKSPHWVGGGVAHGPKPRSYETKITKKVKMRALLSAISLAHENDNIIVLQNSVEKINKTKDIYSFLKKLNIAGKKLIFILSAEDKNIFKAARNIRGVETISSKGINVYNLISSEKLVFTASAFKEVIGRTYT